MASLARDPRRAWWRGGAVIAALMLAGAAWAQTPEVPPSAAGAGKRSLTEMQR